MHIQLCIPLYIHIQFLLISHHCLPSIYSLSDHLGSGHFGTVSQGVWSSPQGKVDVAVKTLKPGSSEEDKVKFLREAAINGQFKHPNVVKLIGVVTVGEPVRDIL